MDLQEFCKKKIIFNNLKCINKTIIDSSRKYSVIVKEGQYGFVHIPKASRATMTIPELNIGSIRERMKIRYIL